MVAAIAPIWLPVLNIWDIYLKLQTLALLLAEIDFKKIQGGHHTQVS